jgi:DNA-binding transcriptional regulator YdaS (Cro superfamily)
LQGNKTGTPKKNYPVTFLLAFSGVLYYTNDMPSVKPKNSEQIKEAFRKQGHQEIREKLQRNFPAMSDNVIWQIISGHLQVSPQRAIEIEKATGVKKEILRPDIFQASN